jgi:hypothetical protein
VALETASFLVFSLVLPEESNRWLLLALATAPLVNSPVVRMATAAVRWKEGWVLCDRHTRSSEISLASPMVLRGLVGPEYNYNVTVFFSMLECRSPGLVMV